MEHELITAGTASPTMMAPGQLYTGPAALAQSKYASPAQRNATLAVFPSAAPSPTKSAVSPSTDTTIATRQQIATANNNLSLDTPPRNANTELAITQGNTLKEEVDRHAAKVAMTLSSAMSNTRQLLELIRDSMRKENAAELQTVEHLWTQLEQLFAAANEAKIALPEFLEKQRNNMSLYHASKLNETIRETQEELNIQHKKVNIQHSLILEHQEAFQDYKAQNAGKLKELEDLQERNSRLTLEKGNLRTEIDKYKQSLTESKLAKTKILQKADALEKELETLVSSKNQLSIENETLRKKLSDAQETTNATEQRITARTTAELQAKDEQLSKEVQKSTSLSVMLNTMKGDESTARLELDKIRLENKALNEKYTNQSAEHAQAFTKLNEQTRKLDTLTIDLARFQKENDELRQRAAKLAELEKLNAEVSQAKSNLQEQVHRLNIELGVANNDSNRAKTELDTLSKKVKKLEHEVENLETENHDVLSKQSENKKVMQALSILKAENSKLKTTVDALRADQVVPTAAGSLASDKEKTVLEEKINDLEAKKTSLENALQEWTDLAKRSYKEYKDILPIYKQANQYRKDALDKEDVIMGLKLELSAAKTFQSNGVGAGGDAAYWKDKYESLLSSVGV
ncbi:Nn.00g001170.m01.CDS01 [Neocucurbitaria sp. VM-36]